MYLPLVLMLFFATTIVSKYGPIYWKCSQDHYIPSSSYEFNLRLLLTNLTTSASKSQNLYSALSTIGVSGVAQCRPDITQLACAFCLNDSSSSHVCRQSFSAVIYRDLCLLSYRNNSFSFSTDHLTLGTVSSTLISSNSYDFGRRVVELMLRIAWEATMLTDKFAVGVVDAGYVQNQKIYGMVWCIMELTSKNCFDCLLNGVSQLRYALRGGSFYHYSCLLRFELYLFFDEHFLENTTSLELDAAGGAGGQGECSLKS
ncbi:putative cysteine-rich receptor-like protein kinase 20 [Phalaenopsis equestris]|uniref:putative cysteine-rich receptor-like protein kinase 20 n=1 Tax=Phalaenopsis equestris TaxID=78828 RepID=UPI0009E2C63A|nr:putative cysteine-rich receptor-like protein kinase 20 [Phalaenopsis equestris]